MSPYDPVPRTIAIVARTAHLLAMAGYLGTQLDGNRASRARWRLATSVTGAALLATELSHSRHWPYQGRGLMAAAHTGILPLGHAGDPLGAPVAVAALVIGAAGSHLPRSIRKWSVLHGRVMPDEWMLRPTEPGRAGADAPRARRRDGGDGPRSADGAGRRA